MGIKKEEIEKTIDKIKKIINEIDSRLIEIDQILNINPLADRYILRIEIQEIMNKDISSVEKAELIKSMSAKEKELSLLANKQQKTIELIKERIKLQDELWNLNNELSAGDRKC